MSFFSGAVIDYDDRDANEGLMHVMVITSRYEDHGGNLTGRGFRRLVRCALGSPIGSETRKHPYAMTGNSCGQFLLLASLLTLADDGRLLDMCCNDRPPPRCISPVHTLRDMLCVAMNGEEDAPEESVDRVAESFLRQSLDFAPDAAYLYRCAKRVFLAWSTPCAKHVFLAWSTP